MLGEKLGDEQGRITLRRVLPSGGGGPRVEVCFEGSGKLFGLDITDIGTYWSVVQPNGLLYGEGQGVIMSTQGDIAQWTGAGRGHFTAQGGVSFRGAVYYQTSSEKLARLNSVAIVFEHEAGADGSVRTQYWEWK